MLHLCTLLADLLLSLYGHTPGNQNITSHSKAPSIMQNSSQSTGFYDLKAETIDGVEFPFSQLKGKRVLIVNTASECGYTPQYKQLEDLYEQYGGEDFVILGFPSNDFGGQEPGSDKEIAAFCQKNYGVTFPLMSKAPVSGKGQQTIYAWLTQKEQNGKQDVEVKWNFNKFLIDENGEWYAYYPSGVEPFDERIVTFAEGK